MEKSYNPSGFEKEIYKNWQDSGFFKASINKNKKPFTIIMPPPNITSVLHIGHVYGNTIMDSITRFKRMQGFEALLLPGVDHAALATEVKVVERLAEKGIKKEDLGREKFIEEMHKWYGEFGPVILKQFEMVGLSADWDRYAFTLDEKRNKAVNYAFVNLYKKGLIYQGSRVTNLCVNCNTALSDVEVEYEENDGKLWYIKYPIVDSEDYIIVATTRPETIVGDVAVAVNPDDERYKKFVGKKVLLPMINREIPIIADNYVDKKFGTGAVKITPAHDPNDFEVGLRHNLQQILVMNNHGFMNENAGKYEGLERFECRKNIINDFDSAGLLVKIEKHKNNVGHCSRCHTIVEPIISKQWYVKMRELADRALQVVKDKEIKFVPQRFEKTYNVWMENIRDWCISRQIWSGHRIPVYYNDETGEKFVEYDDTELKNNPKLRQDEDSLDTWFSSALWPFSTLGWPEKTPELEYFYPTDLMITAYDIIPFWVSRMIFSGLEYTDKIPFSDVLIHGLIRDSQGRKMSKSLGNGINPIDLIEKYGADALRFTLLYGVGIGQDSRYLPDKIESVSNFINKLWNASRFVVDNIEKNGFTSIDINKINLSIADKWIISETNELVKYITKKYEKYDLGLVASTMYDFIWNKFCDWYIEASKVKLYSDNPVVKNEVLNVLVHVLEKLLKLIHPIIPYVTEKIYQELPTRNGSIMIQDFPKYKKSLNFENAKVNMDTLISTIKSVRNLRTSLKIADNVKLEMYALSISNKELLVDGLEVISKLSNAKNITIIENESSINVKNVFVINEFAKIIIPTSEFIDESKEKERLNQELKSIEKEIFRASSMLSNKGFVSNAPQFLIKAEEDKLVKYNEQKVAILNALETL